MRAYRSRCGVERHEGGRISPVRRRVLAAGVARGKEPRVLDDALGPVDGPRCVCRKSRRAQQRTPKRLMTRPEQNFSRGLSRRAPCGRSLGHCVPGLVRSQGRRKDRPYARRNGAPSAERHPAATRLAAAAAGVCCEQARSLVQLGSARPSASAAPLSSAFKNGGGGRAIARSERRAGARQDHEVFVLMMRRQPASIRRAVRHSPTLRPC